MDHTLDTNFVSAKDQWTMFQGGFRLDWDPSEKDRFSLQANLYGGKPNPDGGDTTAIVARGDNIIARWNHTHSTKSDWQLQAYYDHTWRDFKNGFTEDLKTYDLDWQNRYQFGKRHTLTYGMNLRLMNHTVTNLPLFRFEPAQKTLYLYSVYIQDEIVLINDRLRITVGSKVEHNSYTGFEFQPNGRLTWTATQKQTIWTAVSRAVRTPARIDRDFSLYLTPDLALISGSDDFISENVVAYELGWRLQPQNNFSISLATFYNVYNNLRSAEPGPPPFNIPISFANGVGGKTYGLEVSASYQMNSQWSIRGGYTYLKKKLTIEPGSSDLNEGTAESDDPEHQFLIQSNLNVGKKLEVSPVFRYIDKLSKPHVPGYAGLDLRIGLTLNRHLELNLVGQNLLDNRHREFIASTPPREIERSIYGRIICRF
jgi:iron complex outermembrane recepter protein